jgi:hypothetical protein
MDLQQVSRRWGLLSQIIAQKHYFVISVLSRIKIIQILDTTMTISVEHNSGKIAAPPLQGQEMVRDGAARYQHVFIDGAWISRKISVLLAIAGLSQLLVLRN